MEVNKDQTLTFAAPWSSTLRMLTLLAIAICVGVAGSGLISLWETDLVTRSLVIVLPMLIILGCAPFMVRGYTIQGRTLFIHRLGWSTQFNLGELQSFAADPGAMEGSIRLFGNGGLFAFTGLFRNKKLGNYRAFATDRKRAVVLRLKDRVIVVTPDDPARFVEVLGKLGK